MTSFARIAAAGGVLAGITLISATGGAVAGSLVTSAQIKNDTIQSVDVKNGTLGSADVKDDSLSTNDLQAGDVNYLLGIQDRVVQTETATVGPQSNGSVTAECPSGEVLGVAGYFTESNTGVQSAFLPDGLSARVYGANPLGEQNTLVAQIVCARTYSVR